MGTRWTCRGSVRGACGVMHASEEAAQDHCDADMRAVRKGHGASAYSDRWPVEVHGHGGKRAGAGRPESADAMTARVLVRMSDDEQQWLRARAEEKGTTVAGVIRAWIAEARGSG